MYYCDQCGTALNEFYQCPCCEKAFLPPQQIDSADCFPSQPVGPGDPDPSEEPPSDTGKASYAVFCVIGAFLVWIPFVFLSLIFSKGSGYAIINGTIPSSVKILFIGTVIAAIASYSICKNSVKKHFSEQPFFEDSKTTLLLIPFLHTIGCMLLFFAFLLLGNYLHHSGGVHSGLLASFFGWVPYVFLILPFFSSYFHSKFLLERI